MHISNPYALTAEVTHRCPLYCVYCANPLELQKIEAELKTNDWLRVLDEANDLGVVQVHFSGGEPLLRQDLEQLICHARTLGLYVNLITSGVGMTKRRIDQLVDAGVDSVQLSIQAPNPELAEHISGINAFALKQQAAAMICSSGLTLNMNVVIHRRNIHLIEEMIELCVAWGAERLELANTQYYGWALVNREHLLPTRDQLAVAEEAYMRAKERFAKKIELIWVLPDYYEDYPKPCMGGWGKHSLTVAPDGLVLPCTIASNITTLSFDSVKEQSLGWIWRESEAFNAFRGFEWMQEPCRSCEHRERDFGGCRCQSFLLTGNATEADPVCKWSPHHHLITSVTSTIDVQQFQPTYRGRPHDNNEGATFA